MALDPLKFQVAIQDEATGKLNKIEQEFDKLKDKTISVKVEGLSDLQQLLSALQHQQVSNLGKDVGSAINDATKNLQKEAQEAIRTSLGNLAKDLVSVKEAIKSDSFSAFSQRIETCAEKITLLDEAFKKFKVTIGENKELKDLLTGWGAAIKEVSAAMAAMNSVKNGGGAKAAQKEDLKQQEEGLIKVANAMGRVRDAASGGGGASSGGVAFMESINKVGERNIQTLIKEQGHIERLIAIAKKSIDFGEGHPVLGMGRLRGDQMQNLQNLEQLKNIIKEILFAANQGDQAAIRFLNTLGSLKTIPFGKDFAGNDITLLGGHFDKLTHSVTGTATAMRQLNKDMRLDFNKAANKEKLAAEAEAVKKLAASYKSMQQESKTMRSQSESALASRIKMLREQSADLQKLLSVGKIGLGEGQYNSVRDALREIRKELQQIETITQRGGNSTGLLRSLSVGRDYSGVIASGRAVADMRNKQAQETNLASRAVSQLTMEEQRLAQALNQATNSARGQSQVLSDLKSLATQYLGVWGAQGFLRNVIEIGGQLEMQRLSIGAILGDMAKANELFDRIKNLAVKSPFGVVELDSMTKQLSAYGFEYNELYDMTKRLADISAATGTGVDRLALALGHVRSEAALSGYTLRQFSMANIPLARKLSEELTKVEGKFVSVADVRKRVRTKDIGYEQVLKVLKDLTDEGGMFYNAQEIMSESVKARFKNLKDSMDIMYGEIAESSVGGGLKSVAEMLTTLTRHWQELGAVLVTGAGYWAINRLAMMAMSKATMQNNIATGQFTAKQLEAQAITGNLTRQQLLRAVASKKMAIADVEAAGAVLGLTRAQLLHAMNTGKVTAAMNMATIATSKYSVAQLRFMAMFRSLSLFNVKDFFFGIFSGAKAAGSALLGLAKSFFPLLALSAVAEVFMSMKRESESFADAANYVGQSARNMMKDIDNAMKSITKNGKPADTESLREAVNTMKEVLENSEFYTAEQQKQVDAATTLSQKYDILLKQMKEMREESEWQTNNEGLIATILSNTGKRVNTNIAQRFNRETGKYEAFESQTFGLPFFNDSLQENIEQVNKSNSALQSSISLLAEYQGVIEEAIKKNNGFGLSLEGKSWQEQVRIIAQSGHWDEFVASVENAGSRFEKTAANVKKASDKVAEDWKEIVNDDVKAIRLTLMEEWGMTEDEITQFAKNNERTMRWLVDAIAKSLSKLGVAEQIIDEFKAKLLSLFGVAGSGKPVKKDLTEYEKQTDLGKRLMSNVINYNKKNGKGGQGVTTVKEINEITGTGDNQKSVVEVTKALKERAQKSLENMKETKRLWGETSKQYKDAKKKYEHDLNLALSNGISEDEIRTGKYKDKKYKKTTDEDARVLRERVRILKEAADSYQYWRDKVGESQAEAHMQNEFGQLLSEQNLQLKNADELKAKLQELRAEYSKKPQTKAMVEAIKEIDKELAQLERKDFERDTERFLSQTQIQLDSLTRAWNEFDKVVNATGDINLAINISKVDYQNGQHTLADAMKKKIEDEMSSIGVIPIEFNLHLSDKEIEKRVWDAFSISRPVQEKGERDELYNQRLTAYETQIKKIIDAYIKLKGVEENLRSSDIDVYSGLLKNAINLQTEVQKIEKTYLDTIDAIGRLKKEGAFRNNPSAAQKAETIAKARLDIDITKASTSYKMLIDGVTTMNKNAAHAIRNDLIMVLDRAMKEGAITAEEYSKEIDKIEEKMREFEKAPSNLQKYMSGGISGLLDNINNQGASKMKEGQAMINAGQKEAGMSMMKAGQGMQGFASGMGSTVAIIDMIVHGINDLVQGFKQTFDQIREMADALGNDTNSDSWEDWNTFLTSFSNASNSATNAWDSLKNGDIGGTISGVVGSVTSWITGFAKGHDKKRQNHIDALKENVKALQANTQVIKDARNRMLGYDTGRLRSLYSRQYLGADWGASRSEAQKAMYDFYRENNRGNGYSQELANLKKERENVMQMYNEEADKKKSSNEALLEFKQNIAELDDKILHFTEDLAQELWDIDLKGWADQISDSLMTAFENGEDAAEAFNNTVEDIMRQVLRKMLTLGIIEPMMERLQKKLFGENGKGGIFDVNNPEGTIDAAMKEVTAFFGEGGEGQQMINATKTFYDKWEDFMRSYGLTLESDSGSNASRNTIKGVTEQIADLLSSYVNSIHADVSVNRAMIAQYFPMYYQALTSGNDILRGIENHTAAIMRSNEAIEKSNQAILDRIDGLRNNTWRVPMA